MSLLGSVASWDQSRIACTAASHRDADHPMARNGKLSALCGIEYAGQAMAAHGGLTGAGGKARVGYLASVRGLAFHRDRLDDLPGDLTIEAEQAMAEGDHVIYRFQITHEGAPVMSGQAAVVLSA
jgi:predicted hotdog family 3-hydroxylacyl-ACP dehydratase